MPKGLNILFTLIIVFILILGIICVYSFVPRLDCSNVETYIRTKKEMLDSLSIKDKKILLLSIKILTEDKNLDIDVLDSLTYQEIKDKTKELVTEEKDKIISNLKIKDNIDICTKRKGDYFYTVSFINNGDTSICQYSFIASLIDKTGRVYKEIGETKYSIGSLYSGEEEETTTFNFLELLTFLERTDIEEKKEGNLDINVKIISAFENEEDVLDTEQMEHCIMFLELVGEIK